MVEEPNGKWLAQVCTDLVHRIKSGKGARIRQSRLSLNPPSSSPAPTLPPATLHLLHHVSPVTLVGGSQ